MFLHLSVSHSVHRGRSAALHAGIHPAPPPPGPEAGTPGADPLQEQRQASPLGADPPSPQRSACWEIRATSGRYASYWNAIGICLDKFSQNFQLALKGKFI